MRRRDIREIKYNKISLIRGEVYGDEKLLESFNHAINGIIDAVRTQRNMKIHIVAAIGVLIACFLL